MHGALSVYAVCVVALFLKMLAISCYQGYYRLRYKAFTNGEDAAFFGRLANVEELPQVSRAGRAWANDLENIPAFFALAGLAIALNAAAVVIVWLSVVFTVARVAHTVCYLRGLQPWRTVSFAVGLLCLLGLVVTVLQAC
ncbi:MAPEG family protein [Pseudomonas kermanshahensis]|uniref:MAPEG family protein n=1 Tax=Pseudomonas kermanshahensis TaxID=2745482 RepID=UPI0023DAC821|nr:MAPEG family protein [Pseudomonas kermanshahensis]WEL58244.1 MAPEG family protein [Pseudomonas kermanshahensis]